LFALALVALPIAACGSEDDGGAIGGGTVPSTTAAPGGSTTAPGPTTTTAADANGTVVEVEVEGGVPVGGSQDVQVDVGSTLTIRVTADVEDEVHVHGYDLHADTVVGEPVEITFVADIPGQFEVELEDAGELLLDLTVS
jgi:hypothetical protein